MVSIIISFSEKNSNAERAIDTAVRQTYKNKEVILINYSGVLTEEWKRQGVKNISVNEYSPWKQKLLSLQEAEGEYVLLMDDSELLDSKCIELLRTAVGETKAEIAEGGYYHVDGKMKILCSDERKLGIYSSKRACEEMFGVVGYYSYEDFLRKSIFKPNFCSKLIKKELFSRIKTNGFCDDEIMLYSLFRASNKICYIGNSIAYKTPRSEDVRCKYKAYVEKCRLYGNNDVLCRYMKVNALIYAVKNDDKGYVKQNSKVFQENKSYIEMFLDKKKSPIRIFRSFKYRICRQFIGKNRKEALKQFYSNCSKNKIYIVDVPTYDNLGDQAILIAEQSFLNKYFPDMEIIKLTRNDYYAHRKYMKKYMTQKDVIAFHGGGNIGDIYVHIELLRHRIAGDFQKNRFFVFPQTAHFTDTLFGKAILKKGSRAYLKNKELCIFAREEVSFNFLKNKLPKIKSELCPDIVMSLNMSEGQISRRGGLLCLRTDRESKLSIEDIIEVRRILNDKFDYVNTTDTYSTVEYINDENRMYEFERKIGIFKEYECVVTDRLHGMIFAAISGTPCVVLGNYNHKISSSYNWLKHLPYVKYIENIEALPNAVEEVRSTTGFTYDNSFGDKYYSKIVDYIKNI